MRYEEETGFYRQVILILSAFLGMFVGEKLGIFENLILEMDLFYFYAEVIFYGSIIGIIFVLYGLSLYYYIENLEQHARKIGNNKLASILKWIWPILSTCGYAMGIAMSWFFFVLMIDGMVIFLYWLSVRVQCTECKKEIENPIIIGDRKYCQECADEMTHDFIQYSNLKRQKLKEKIIDHENQ